MENAATVETQKTGQTRLPENTAELLNTVRAKMEEIAAGTASDEDYHSLAVLVATEVYHAGLAGDGVEGILVNPKILDKFKAAWDALPEEMIHPDVRASIPIVPEERIPSLRTITTTDLERQFLENYHGPNGTGLLPRIREYLERNHVPVRITLEWLRNRYLDDLAELVKPKIVQPSSERILLDLNKRR